MKKYTAKDGFKTLDLLHFGFDHLKAAGVLFKASYELFDSAGHLAHLGTELLLKAILLHEHGEFPNTHDLPSLLRSIRATHSAFLTGPDLEVVLVRINQFVDLRYPDAKVSKSIGDPDWDDTRRLREAIVGEMPRSLRDEIRNIDPLRKGGRALYEAPDNNKTRRRGA